MKESGPLANAVMGEDQWGKLGKLTTFACEKKFWENPN